jgi:hypothetical protein
MNENFADYKNILMGQKSLEHNTGNKRIHKLDKFFIPLPPLCLINIGIKLDFVEIKWTQALAERMGDGS